MLNNNDLANQVNDNTPPIISSVNGVTSTYGIFSNSNPPVTHTIKFLNPLPVSDVALNLMDVTGLAGYYYDIVDFGGLVPTVSNLGLDDAFANGKLFGNQPNQYDYGVGAFDSVFYSGPIPNNAITFTVETSTPGDAYNFVDVGLGNISYDPVPETTPLAVGFGTVVLGVVAARWVRRTA